MCRFLTGFAEAWPFVTAGRYAALGNNIDVVSQFVLGAMRRFLTGLAEAWPFVTVHARAIAFTYHVVFVYLSYISTIQV